MGLEFGEDISSTVLSACLVLADLDSSLGIIFIVSG